MLLRLMQMLVSKALLHIKRLLLDLIKDAMQIMKQVLFARLHKILMSIQLIMAIAVNRIKKSAMGMEICLH